ncbi:MAG: 2,3-bisphosphoglycerate-independent phosphoglycerate mutase, partial [Kiritimatiellia bacterium]
EQMVDYATGLPKTSHTLNLVSCIYVAKDAPGKTLVPKGKLSDIAPTVLQLLGIPKPAEMTASTLLA